MTCPVCERDDCIMRPEEHGVCAARTIPGHECKGSLTKQHRPKIGMGGNNPKSKVVAHLDWLIHDALDNGLKYEGRRLRDQVLNYDGERFYRIYDRDTGDRLVSIPLTPSTPSGSEEPFD